MTLMRVVPENVRSTSVLLLLNEEYNLYVSISISGSPILNIDDKRTLDLVGEGVIEKLKAETALEPISISTSTSKLIDTIVKSPPSTIALRKAIRKHIAASINIDIIEDAQINFIESVMIYYLNILGSPCNPLSLHQLERTAAVHTTVFLVNTLFLDVNDIIGFKWFEVTAYMTSNTKWDGIGFSRKNEKMVTLLVELSGGLKHNCTDTKNENDIQKLIPGAIQCIELTTALTKQEAPIPEYIIRFFDGNLYLESVMMLEAGFFIRRMHVKIPIPNTIRSLQKLISCTPQMFKWREAVVRLTQNIDEACE
ncbi:unnamed protein product [Rhizopus stolonifer]